MNEKRRFRRRSLAHNLIVSDSKTGTQVGQLANLSPEGFMLVTSECLVDKTIMNLQITLPEKTHERHVILCKAECKWCSRSENSELFEAGFQLLDMNDSIRAELGSIIAEYLVLD
jgi:hypothetical protein